MLQDAALFFLDILLKRCTIDYRLDVRIYLMQPRKAKPKEPMVEIGQATEMLTKEHVWYKIDLSNDLNTLDMLTTLAHELVHVVQFVTGRLHSEEDWIFEGKNYGEDPYKGTEADTKLPWEHEAYSKEVELAKKFVKKYYSNW